MPLVTRGDGVSLPESNQAIISTSVDVFDQDGFNLGFLESMTRTDARPTTPIRHLDARDAGRIIEQAPQPETVTLAVTGFALYNRSQFRNSIMHRLPGAAGANFRSLNSQGIPFELVEEWEQPATRVRGRNVYLDCYLTNYTRPVNIGTVTIAETANITVSYVE